MNKQGPGKIDYCDFTWNPIAGCKHGCLYCYVKAMAKRFGSNLMEPKFCPERLNEPAKLKTPSKIFVGSSGDMWGSWVDSELIIDVIHRCATHAQWHTYQFLTKNPQRYFGFVPFPNCWYGTTIDGLPFTHGNLEKLVHSTKGAKVRFISFEPLLGPVHPNLYDIDWIIIGADSTRGAEKPPDKWADTLIDYAKGTNTAVWVKDNYRYSEIIKEWPK